MRTPRILMCPPGSLRHLWNTKINPWMEPVARRQYHRTGPGPVAHPSTKRCRPLACRWRVDEAATPDGPAGPGVHGQRGTAGSQSASTAHGSVTKSDILPARRRSSTPGLPSTGFEVEHLPEGLYCSRGPATPCSVGRPCSASYPHPQRRARPSSTWGRFWASRCCRTRTHQSAFLSSGTLASVRWPPARLIYYPAAFDAYGRQRCWKRTIPRRCWRSRRPKAHRFGCNAVVVAQDDRRSPTAAARKPDGRPAPAGGYEVIGVELDEFLKSGGSVECLTLCAPGLAGGRGGLGLRACSERSESPPLGRWKVARVERSTTRRQPCDLAALECAPERLALRPVAVFEPLRADNSYRAPRPSCRGFSMRERSLFVLFLFAMLVSGELRAEPNLDDTCLLSQPAVSGKHVAFVYADDLWVADLDGRNARRLTSDTGIESHPAFSPDGKTIAFSAQYDGNTDVYTIPVAGGRMPTRSFHSGTPESIRFRGFTPDGKEVPSSPLGPARLHESLYAALHRAPDRRHADATADPARRRGLLLSRRRFDRLHAVERSHPAMEALPGRHPFSVSGSTRRKDHHVEEVPQPEGTLQRHSTRTGSAATPFSSAPTAAASTTSMRLRHQDEEGPPGDKARMDFPVLDLGSGGGRLIYEQAGYLHLLDPAASSNGTRLKIGVATDLVEARPRLRQGREEVHSPCRRLAIGQACRLRVSRRDRHSAG